MFFFVFIVSNWRSFFILERLFLMWDVKDFILECFEQDFAINFCSPFDNMSIFFPLKKKINVSIFFFFKKKKIYNVPIIGLFLFRALVYLKENLYIFTMLNLTIISITSVYFMIDELNFC